MHPQVRQDQAGLCSLCGMDLVQLDSSEMGMGAGRVSLSKRARALAKVQTTRVVPRPGATAQIELMGRFTPKGMRVKSVTAPAKGWIERVIIDAPGRAVIEGDLLARIHVPGVYSAHRILLEAYEILDRVEPESAVYRQAKTRFERARQTLLELGASEPVIKYMAEEDVTPNRSLPVLAPATGTILKRYLHEGAYVTPGAPIYQIADLSALWLILDIHEKDLPQIGPGDHVEVTIDAYPGEVHQGEVTYIDETVHPARRTATARVHINNPTWKIRAGMFARATLTPQKAKEELGRLVIPASAPLFTGRRAVVYLERGDQEHRYYVPRTVRLGPQRGDVYPVIAGLAMGDRVVTRGAFALDADLQLRGGPSMMAGPDDETLDPRHEPTKLSKEEVESLKTVYYGYLELQSAFADDDLRRVRHNAGPFFERVKGLLTLSSNPRAQRYWKESRGHLVSLEVKFKSSKSLEELRRWFLEVSQELIRVMARHANPLPYGLRLAYCPMAFDNLGAYWIQKEDSVDNPYFGAEMLLCGEIRQRLGHGDFLMVPADLGKMPKAMAKASHQP